MSDEKQELWADVVDDLVSKSSKKEINTLVKLFTIGLFLIMVAIAYSIIFRGSVSIDMSTNRNVNVEETSGDDIKEAVEEIENELSEDSK